MNEVKITRGCRNNNPLNIRRSRSNWLGKVSFRKSSDSVFEQFDTMEHGLRAAMCLLIRYINVYKLQSVRAVIHRWAPACDGNNEDAYVAYVSKQLRSNFISPYYFQATSSVIVNLVRSMAYVESSQVFSYDYLFKIFCKYF